MYKNIADNAFYTVAFWPVSSSSKWAIPFVIYTPPVEDFGSFLQGVCIFKWNSLLDTSTCNSYTLCGRFWPWRDTEGVWDLIGIAYG